MQDKLAKRTTQVLEHVERAREAISNFREDGINAEGVLTHPQFQASARKVAREELYKAIAIIEQTKWGSQGSA